MWVFMDIQKETSPETIINQAFRELYCLCDHRCNGINLDQAQSLKEPNGSEPQESRSTSTEKIIVYSVWPLFKAVQTVHFHREDSQFNQSAIGEVVSFSLSYSNLPFERIRSFTSSLIAGKQLDMTHLSAFSRAERFEKVSTNLFQFFHIFSFLKLKLHASTAVHEHCLTHSTCFALQSVGPCGSSAESLISLDVRSAQRLF